METNEDSSFDASNSVFWNELCGTQLANSIGITDSSSESIRKFDSWYFRFYPYLYDYLTGLEVRGKVVLEVGLGYGSSTQFLAESGAKLTAIDVAQGPVSHAQHRLKLENLAGNAVQKSILKTDFGNGTFDVVVAIGSLHHTGDLRLSIQQTHRLLKPGGLVLLMVYNAFSYRRWIQQPRATLLHSFRELFGHRGVVGGGSPESRGQYDANSNGESAPHTDWISAKSLAHELKQFENLVISRHNIAQEWPFPWLSRDFLLRTCLPEVLGLDLYASARKPLTDD